MGTRSSAVCAEARGVGALEANAAFPFAGVGDDVYQSARRLMAKVVLRSGSYIGNTQLG